MPVRQRIALASALPLLLFSGSLLAQSEPTPTTAAGPVEVPETTEVQGTVSEDLVGRWLVVGDIKLPDGKVRPVTRAWEIRHGSEQLELVLARAELPDAVNQKVAKAANEDRPWTPEPDDLRQVAESWGTGKLPTGAPDLSSLRHKILAPEAYPAEYQSDELTKDTKLTISLQENFTGQHGVIRTISVFGLRDRTPTTLQGSFVTTTLAAAPLPIPITLKGDFRAYRVRAPRRSPGSNGSSPGASAADARGRPDARTVV